MRSNDAALAIAVSGDWIAVVAGPVDCSNGVASAVTAARTAVVVPVLAPVALAVHGERFARALTRHRVADQRQSLGRVAVARLTAGRISGLKIVVGLRALIAPDTCLFIQKFGLFSR